MCQTTSAGDSVGFSVATDYELAASALGACVWCLKRAQLDYSLLSLASFVVRHVGLALWLFHLFFIPTVL